jgi:F0F1-type ATP synthase assembly protein I
MVLVVEVVLVLAVVLVDVAGRQVAALYGAGIITIAFCNATWVCAYMRPVTVAPVTTATFVCVRMMP